jgi:hypothetical protein
MITNNNQVKFEGVEYYSTLMEDPYKMQYLACLTGIDTDEIPNGYSVSELETMIEFLNTTKEKLIAKNNALTTSSMFLGDLE